MNLAKEALELHKKLKGKIEIKSKHPVLTKEILSLLYTPGVAEVSREIAKHKEKVYEYTSKWNTVAIVTDGSRVLGLGNIGPEAALPVMEGKAILFKLFGQVDAFPLCLNTQKAEEIVEIIKNISPSFGGINLEDIDSPKCFEIVDRLNGSLDIPVYHDDQHGSGIVVAAGVINSLKVVGKKLSEARVVIAGAGSAGYGTAMMLHAIGIKNILAVDSKGIIHSGRNDLNKYKQKLASISNKGHLEGSLSNALDGADVLIGASGIAGLFKNEMIGKMSDDAIVFALTNPTPEIMPEDAKDAAIIATGRSDYPNQINNVLAFPAVMRGLLDVRAKMVNDEILIASTYALVDIVKDELRMDYVIPLPTDERILPAVSKAVRDAAIKTGVAQVKHK
ncbi:MAG: NADP-dependent malic enzyme [Candidatus Aenigmarchaeota archaeon]|nr:NADP-dependent malic enzyme [Candidatus Aenigmarchaeota archaeon]